MSEVAAKQSHPKGLWVLFGTEMWERFNFYGMRAILTLFMVNALMMKEDEASIIYGGFLGLCYLTPMLGGFIADRFLGNRNCIMIGGVMMAIGQIMLFFSASIFGSNLGLANGLLWGALGIIVFGNGFFKPNISAMVGQLYPENDKRKDSAYTIFYMGINTGGAIGPFVCGFFGDTGNPADFKWAFLAAGIGMLLSVVVMHFFHNKYVVDQNNQVLGLTPKDAPAFTRKPLYVFLGLLVFSFISFSCSASRLLAF